MKYKIIACIFFFALGFSQLAIAQPSGGKGKMSEEAKAKIKALHKAYMTDKLDLSDQEAEAFWPIYHAYKKEERNLQKSFRKMKKSAKDMSDAEAEQFILDRFELEQKKLDLKKQVFQELKSVISPKKIIRLERAERSFRMEVMKRMKNHREKKRGERSID